MDRGTTTPIEGMLNKLTFFAAPVRPTERASLLFLHTVNV